MKEIKDLSHSKRDGVYYTPPYLIDFILKNTIDLRLTNSISNLDSLLQTGDINALIAWTNEIQNIKICDPACGAGAFLLKILDKFKAFYHSIEEIKIQWQSTNKSKKGSNEIFSRLNTLYIQTMSEIVNRHLYGVDVDHEGIQNTNQNLINETSDQANSQLSYIDGTIKYGNSLIFREFIKERIDLLRWNEFIRVRNQISDLKGNSIEQRKKLLTQQKNLITSLSDQLAPKKFAIQDSPDAFSWELNFPEILNRGGFSYIVGNPPYIQLSMEKTQWTDFKEYLIDNYKSSMGRLNTFGFFIILGIRLLQEHGILAFIVPNTLLTNQYYVELRQYILKTCQIRLIGLLQYLPFKDAIVENIIIILQKEASEDKRKKNYIEICDLSQSLSQIHTEGFISKGLFPPIREDLNWKVSQANWQEDKANQFSIYLTDDLLKIKNRFFQNFELIRDRYQINQAIAIKKDRSKVLVNKEECDPTRGEFYPVLDGRNIEPYLIKPSNIFLKYDRSAIHSCKKKEIFLKETKIFVRRVGRKIIAAIDTEKFFALNTLVVISQKDGFEQNPDHLYFLLGVLNSHIMNNYFQLFHKSTKQVFSEIQARQLEQIPIPIANESKINEIAQINKEISNLKHKMAQKDQKIQELFALNEQKIVEIYGLTKQDIAFLQDQIEKTNR